MWSIFGVLSLSILFGVKQNHYNISQYTIAEGFKQMNIPQKVVSHSNVARVLLMIAYILPTIIGFGAAYQINMSPTVKENRI